MKIRLDNAQGVPILRVMDFDEMHSTKTEILRVYFCNDGGIVQTENSSIGTQLGARPKQEQAEFEDAGIRDDLLIE